MTSAREVIYKRLGELCYCAHDFEEADSILSALREAGFSVLSKAEIDTLHKEGWKAAKMDGARPVEVLHVEFGAKSKEM